MLRGNCVKRTPASDESNVKILDIIDAVLIRPLGVSGDRVGLMVVSLALCLPGSSS